MTARLLLIPLMMVAHASVASAQTPPAPPAAADAAAPPAAGAQPAPPPAPAAPQPYSPAPAPQTYAPPPPGYAPVPGYPPPPGYPYPPPPGYPYAAPGYPYPSQRGYAPQALPTPPGYHTHDGTYVRLDVGLSYTNMWATDPTLGKVEFSGNGGALGVAVGAAVLPNFIVHGTFLIAGASDPDVHIGGVGRGSANGDTDLLGFGVGAVYYLEPLNFYFGGSVLGTRLDTTDHDGNELAATELGFGFEGIVGKEWWVSDNWGLGIAFEGLYARMKDKNIFATGSPRATWTGAGGALLFSATFN